MLAAGSNKRLREEQTESKASRMKEVMKTRAEINEIQRENQ